jgi:hypothetical protein
VHIPKYHYADLIKENLVGTGEERNVYRVLVGNPRRKEATRKTETLLGGWDQNVS